MLADPSDTRRQSFFERVKEGASVLFRKRDGTASDGVRRESSVTALPPVAAAEETLQSAQDRMATLSNRRQEMEAALKSSESQQCMVKLKFPDTFPLAAKRFVFEYTQTVDEACAAVQDILDGRGVAQAGFKLAIPADERSREAVQRAVAQCELPEQVVFLEPGRTLRDYRPLLEVIGYLDFVPPPSFRLPDEDFDATQRDLVASELAAQSVAVVPSTIMTAGRGAGGLDAPPEVAGRGHARRSSVSSPSVSMSEWLGVLDAAGRGSGLDEAPTQPPAGRGDAPASRGRGIAMAGWLDKIDDGVAGVGRGTGLDEAPAVAGRGERAAPTVDMADWLDRAESAGRGTGLDAAPAPAGRGEAPATRGRGVAMGGWLDQLNAGRGTGLDAPPNDEDAGIGADGVGRGRGVAMGDWLDMANAGRGTGLDAPPIDEADAGAGRGRIRSTTLPAVAMSDWLDAALRNTSAGRGASGLDAPPPAGRGDASRGRGIAMGGWLDQAVEQRDGGAGRGSGLDAPPPIGAGRGDAVREPMSQRSVTPAEVPGDDRMSGWLDALFVQTAGRGRGGLVLPPPSSGRGQRSRYSSAVDPADMDFVQQLQPPPPLAAPPDATAAAPQMTPKDLAEMLKEQQQQQRSVGGSGRRGTFAKLQRPMNLQATLPVLCVFPPHFGLPAKVVQVPSKLSVGKAMDYLAEIHGGFFSAAGAGLCVKPQEYAFDDAFRRSATFPFLEPGKPLQWYEEVVTTVPLYWEKLLQQHGGGVRDVPVRMSQSESLAASVALFHAEPSFAAALEAPRTAHDVKVVLPSALGVAPVTVTLDHGMSVTDAELAIARALEQRDGAVAGATRLRLCVPPALQHLPEVNVEIVKLGLRDAAEWPLFALGRTISEYAPLLDVLPYVEMAAAQ